MKLTFGKHSGKTLEQVAEIDPGYIRWMAENMSSSKWRDAANAVLFSGSNTHEYDAQKLTRCPDCGYQYRNGRCDCID